MKAFRNCLLFENSPLKLAAFVCSFIEKRKQQQRLKMFNILGNGKFIYQSSTQYKPLTGYE